MIAIPLISSLILIGSAQPAADAKPAVRTVPDTCPALEAAYTAAIGGGAPAYPSDIRPSWRPVELGKFVPEFKARLALAPGEFEDLMANEAGHDQADYRPLCASTATPSRRLDEDGHRQFVSFSNPIFSTDERLAIVEISFREDGGFGYGQICVVRRRSAAWTAHCTQSWIT